MNKNIYIFVYGSLKCGFSNSYFLKNSKFIGTSITSTKYALFKSAYGSFPILLKEEPNNYIPGELYLIDSNTLSEIDSFEGHPTFFKRELIYVKTNEKIFKAWCYFFQDEKGSFRIPIEEWVEI